MVDTRQETLSCAQGTCGTLRCGPPKLIAHLGISDSFKTIKRMD
jgi:hypothetical protein